MNGFGVSLGDSLIGLQALHAAQTLGALPLRPVLLRRPGTRGFVEAVYAFADFAEALPFPPDLGPTPTDPLPWPKGRYDEVIDIRDFAFDPAFRGVAMIDYFLARLGVDPEAVATSLKRISWLAPRIRPLAPAGLPQGYVLVCPHTSMTLRDMPAEVHADIISWLAEHTAQPVLTQGALPPAAPGVAREIPPCASLPELCGLVAGARLVISTDTAMVHLADAFAVPCLAFFTTHRPEWRVRDYPLCMPVHLPVPGLPQSLEFARNDTDLAAASQAWFPAGSDFGWLHAALERAVEGSQGQGSIPPRQPRKRRSAR